MKRLKSSQWAKMPRRSFLVALGGAGAWMALSSKCSPLAVWADEGAARQEGTATVRGAFLYPSTESLKRAGYYSWPGAGFDAEGRQRDYTRRIEAIEQKLGMRIAMNEQPLHDPSSVSRFISGVKQQAPDGLLLMPFKKSEWESVVKIIQETQIPTVILATTGILLNPHINQLHREPGVYLICSLDDLAAVEYGMNTIRTMRWMRDARIVSLVGSRTGERIVEGLGTQIRVLPRARFAEEYKRTDAGPEVQRLARSYLKRARRVVEPSRPEVLEAAKTYFACKRILETEGGDAMMMECLGGIRERKFPPPCMGFMSLRDEGIAAGCQNDLNATLTMMLLQELFDRPGFQQNASAETEHNHYFGAHCTSASRLRGTTKPPEPYILRNHAESGIGVVPQVLWRKGQEVTMAHYVAGKPPQMIVYSGKVVRCYDTPPAGGCRTNVEITINELEDVCDVKGMHQTIIYGDYARQLRAFCQLYGIEVVT